MTQTYYTLKVKIHDVYGTERGLSVNFSASYAYMFVQVRVHIPSDTDICTYIKFG